MADSRILLMRHGQSEGNVARVWTSSHTGYPLTDLGREQARAAAAALHGRGVSAVYGSPLVRARQTAAEVAKVLGLEPRELLGVEELHVGVHEGRHDDEVGPVAVEVFGRWWRDTDLAHGFEGGETGHQIASRMETALRSVVERHPGETTVVVSHGGAMAVGATAMCPEVDPAFVAENLLANCAVVELVYGSGAWRCESWAGVALTQPGR